MKKEFVTYEIALELKELGFDEECLAWTIPNETNFIISPCEKYGERFDKMVQIPTFSQVFRWFREKYDLVIEPCVPFQRLYSTEEDHFEILEFGYRIYSFDQYRGGLRDKIEWDGYDNSNEEEAELECLKKLIEIVKNK